MTLVEKEGVRGWVPGPRPVGGLVVEGKREGESSSSTNRGCCSITHVLLVASKM